MSDAINIAVVSVGDKVRALRDFSEERQLYGMFKFVYPYKGEIWTVREIGPHPLPGHRMFYFEECHNGISDISVNGPNFELVRGV